MPRRWPVQLKASAQALLHVRLPPYRPYPLFAFLLSGSSPRSILASLLLRPGTFPLGLGRSNVTCGILRFRTHTNLTSYSGNLVIYYTLQ